MESTIAELLSQKPDNDGQGSLPPPMKISDTKPNLDTVSYSDLLTNMRTDPQPMQQVAEPVDYYTEPMQQPEMDLPPQEPRFYTPTFHQPEPHVMYNPPPPPLPPKTDDRIVSVLIFCVFAVMGVDQVQDLMKQLAPSLHSDRVKYHAFIAFLGSVIVYVIRTHVLHHLL